MFYKKGSIYMIVLFSFLLLSACNNAKSTLTIVVPFNGYQEYIEEEVLQQFLNEFGEDVNIEVVSLYGNRYNDNVWYSMPSDFLSVNDADIFLGFTRNQYDIMIKNNSLYDITDFINLWSDKIYEPILNSWVFEDRYYGISPGFFNYGLAYNTDLINEEKLFSQDNFLESLGDLNLTIALPGVNSPTYLYNFIFRPFEERLFVKSAEGIVIKNKKRLEKYINFLQMNKNQISLNIDDFWFGKTDLAIINPKDIDYYVGAKEDVGFKDIKYKITSLPSLIGSNNFGYAIPGDMIGIAAESENTEISLEFLSFMLANYRKTINDSGSMGNFPVYDFKEWKEYELNKPFFDEMEIPQMDILNLKMSENRLATSIIDEEISNLDKYSSVEILNSIEEKLNEIK